MTNIFKPNTICLVLQGRHAGTKCVVVQAHDNLVTVVGLSSFPRQVKPSHTPKQAERRNKFGAFIKIYHARHLMPTRYTYKQAFSGIVNQNTFKDANNKKKATTEVQTKLQDDYKTNKDSWMFKKLHF